ncbi:MAG: hypothetical protein IID31_12785 [Planctomycetes bacterium]|nr:hypothetical protein [Planctomycetota bacterium]
MPSRHSRFLQTRGGGGVLRTACKAGRTSTVDLQPSPRSNPVLCRFARWSICVTRLAIDALSRAFETISKAIYAAQTLIYAAQTLIYAA